MTQYTSKKISELNNRFADMQAQAILAWALEEFKERLTLASSFGAEDVVLIDILSKITPTPRLFFLDTGRLHQQTYDVVSQVRSQYNIEIDVFCPQATMLEKLLRERGPNSFYESVERRKECCFIRKVEPLSRALENADAWTTGLRRSQSLTRSELAKVEIDEGHGGILKINPLADWSEEDIWNYIRANNVPYNKLHDAGFPSIGCAPCTRAAAPGEDIRAGRWWWESPEQKECGLHIKDGEVIRK